MPSGCESSFAMFGLLPEHHLFVKLRDISQHVTVFREFLE
jgi:hypothetical protein